MLERANSCRRMRLTVEVMQLADDFGNLCSVDFVCKSVSESMRIITEGCVLHRYKLLIKYEGHHGSLQSSQALY
ncbi:hypothetical protein D3C84_638610 [compost metagenome]